MSRGPAAAKLLSPNVLCVHGTAHDLLVDEQSRHLEPFQGSKEEKVKFQDQLFTKFQDNLRTFFDHKQLYTHSKRRLFSLTKIIYYYYYYYYY